MSGELTTFRALADLHHQYLLGLQLMVSTRCGVEVVGDWMFRLFRRQHEQKFLSSFEKLGLTGLPHAVACARYHVLSNGIGGVPVEYMEESDRKAWVRFRYPRWMFDGPAICGIPIEASRGFLRGWYAQNGVSLGNPRLGFVCVSEDMAGFGLCGYFREYDHDLEPEGRLRFAPEERPPTFDPAMQPAPPGAHWPEGRLAKAARNYAVDFVRNGLTALADTIGVERAGRLADEAAHLTGLQVWRELSGSLGTVDGGPDAAVHLLAALYRGMGDEVNIETGGEMTRLSQREMRILRGLDGDHRALVLSVWSSLGRGVIHAHRQFMDLDCAETPDGFIWTIRDR